MKLPPFAYARARTVDEALELLGEAGGEAKLLAGGQSLVPVLAYRLFRPTHLVDVDSVEGLDGIVERDGELELGALVRHARLEQASLDGAHRLLALAARHIGHAPIRTRGTLGGSLAHADPAAELPVAAVALEARVVARCSRGEREIELSRFLLGPFTTALEPDEMIVGLRIPPAPPRSYAGFREFALRSGDFALASVGAIVECDEDGAVCRARIVVGGVEPVPMPVDRASNVLTGDRLGAEAIAEAARVAASSCEPVGDRSVDAATRRELVAALARQALSDVHAQAAA
jgi:carbon-monoxide dehydrogenase medium subunit/6-hydroxypseudooxynicotine dehydrogenase subunit alpha